MKPHDQRVVTSINISKAILQRLDRIAYERGVSRCAVIRDALLRHVRSDVMTLTNERKGDE